MLIWTGKKQAVTCSFIILLCLKNDPGESQTRFQVCEIFHCGLLQSKDMYVSKSGLYNLPNQCVHTNLDRKKILQCVQVVLPLLPTIHFEATCNRMGLEVVSVESEVKSIHTSTGTYFSSFMAICRGSVSPSSSTITGAHILKTHSRRESMNVHQDSHVLNTNWVLDSCYSTKSTDVDINYS